MEEPAEERNGSTGVAPDLERMDGNGESNPTPVDPVQALPPGKFAKDAEEVVMAEEAAEEGGKKKPVAPKVSFFALFKYADFYDYLLMILSCLPFSGASSTPSATTPMAPASRSSIAKSSKQVPLLSPLVLIPLFLKKSSKSALRHALQAPTITGVLNLKVVSEAWKWNHLGLAEAKEFL
jgi:hypothetical protein